MENKKLSKQLAKDAKTKGICREWHDKLKSLEDKKAMVEMYLNGIDFCLANNYPSNDFILANFADVAPQMGVFVDADISVGNKPKCVALGATFGKVTTDGFNVSEVFAKHTSEIEIVAKDNAFVMVDVFDEAQIVVHAYDRAKVCVNIYGGFVTHETFDDAQIKIREKVKTSY
jgi:hypothetical protein